jgi:signal transduction histidine kinase
VEHRSGRDLPNWQWETDYRNPTFHLRLNGTETRRYYLRVWTRESMAVPIRLWQAEAFATASRTESFNYGLFYGVCGLVLLFHLIALALTREGINGWFAVYLSMYGVTAATTLGHFQQVAAWHGPGADLLLALTVCMLLGVGTTFALLQMNASAVMPRFSRTFQTAMWTAAIGLGTWVLLGRYDDGLRAAELTMLASMVLLMCVGVARALHGDRHARYFSLIFGVLYASVIARYLINWGFAPPSAAAEFLIPAASLAHVIGASLNIVRRNQEAKRARLAEQTSLNELLEAKIAERTTELRSEIAARMALENNLREALDAEIVARQQQREFVAMVSHEFRTPLAIIDTSAQRIVGTQHATREATLARCENIRVATQRMTQLMDEFLASDRLSGDLRTLDLVTCNVRELIEQVVSELRDKRVVVTWREAPATLRCDASLMRIALHNLVSNALRYSPNHTTVAIAVERRAQDMVAFAVRDEGPGIAQDELPRLFERYFRGRASRFRSGAGLGLYLVDHIVRLHGGSVQVDSTPGAGSQFTLVIPATAVEPEALAATA